MFECTVTVGDEEESSYYGMSVPHAMELALFRYAYLPWCKSSSLSDDEHEANYEDIARRQEWKSVRRAMVERAIEQVRAAAARKLAAEAVTESRTVAVDSASNIRTTTWQGRAA